MSAARRAAVKCSKENQRLRKYPNAELIGPEEAKQLLDTNESNRNLRPPKMEAIARDMSAGHYTGGYDPILVSKEGKLLDGQHRLHAVVRSGVPHWFLFHRDVPESEKVNMGTGTQRSLADHLHFHAGTKYAGQIQSVLRLIWADERGLLRSVGYQTPSHADLLEIWERDKALITRGLEVAGKPCQEFRVMANAVATFLYWAFAQADTDAAELFFDALANGTNLGAKDPALTLRNKLLRDRANPQTKVDRMDYIALACAAFQKYRKGEQVQKLKRPDNIPSVRVFVGARQKLKHDRQLAFETYVAGVPEAQREAQRESDRLSARRKKRARAR